MCLAIANISDRRKVGGLAMAQLKRVESLLSVFPILALCFLLSLPWVNVSLPSGCLRNTGCLSDLERWSQRVSYSKGPEVAVAVSFAE